MQISERVRLAEPIFEEDEIQAVVEVLRSGNLVQGARVAEFERAAAEYLGAEYAVANASGTAALHLSLMAIGIGEGDEVIVPDFTFPSMANMVELLGGVTVPVDIDPSTFNLDEQALQAKITERTRAIVPVHLFGMVANLSPILKLARAAGIAVVEDAACALGATYPEPSEDGKFIPRQVGSQSDMACISYHPRKVITTGEGGMVVTNDAELAATLRELRNLGTTPRDGRMTFQRVGFNYRLTEMQGCLGLSQLSRLERFIKRRRELAQLYDRLLEPLPLTIPCVPAGFGHVYQSYVVLLPEHLDRDEAIKRLARLGIESTIGTYSLHLQPYYIKKYKLSSADFPNSNRAFRKSLALPIHPRMPDDAVHRSVDALRQVLEEMEG